MAVFREDGRPGLTGAVPGSPAWFVQAVGLGLIVAGALVDAGYHLWWSGDARHAGIGLLGHLITLAGMVVTIAAVVHAGVRSSHRRSLKGDFDASGRSPSAS
jgi:membrane protein implicated in regulation of membrane protease activity